LSPKKTKKHADRVGTSDLEKELDMALNDRARISLDVDPEQKKFLQLFAVDNQISASIVMRALIFKLESDVDLQQDLLDLIYYTPGEDEMVDEDEA
jgi:hypothetical protein